MSDIADLQELYQQLIIDHGRNPRNFGKLVHANYIKEGYNPLCGDRLTVYLSVTDNRIQDIRFEGSGCAISVATASLMTEALKNKTFTEAEVLFDYFHDLLTGSQREDAVEKLGKLMVFAGVVEYPMRVKCATLSWHTAMAAMENTKEPVSTE